MCRYFGYFLSVWALALGSFYAYMVWDVIQSIRGLAGPLGAFQSLLGSSSEGGIYDIFSATRPSDKSINSDDLNSSRIAIYEMINTNLNDEGKREKYIREFLPDVGLEEHHYKEINSVMANFQIENLKEHLEDVEKYIKANVKDATVLKRALAKLEEFKVNTANIDEALDRLAKHMSSSPSNDEL